MNVLPRVAVIIPLFLFAATSAAQEVKMIQDFETPADLRAWDFKSKSASLSDQHATKGKHSIKVTTPEYLFANRPPRDWSGYDSLDLDVFVEGDATVTGTVLVGDDAWKAKGGTYWNRHNGSFTLHPGANVVSIPVNGLYRGEAGSRNNDIKANIDPKTIARLDIGFATKDKTPATLYLDHLRLTKESRPAGILAFDLGPTSQMVSPGFTAIGPDTVYGKGGATAGLNYVGGQGQTRDDTFPTRLYRDCILMDGFVFTADVPEKSGTYHGWVVYNDLGYWGGEQAPFKTRQIVANNQVVFTQDRGDAGPTDYLYKFEKVEPKPGDNLWDLYMKELFAPRRFTCKAEDGKVRLKFSADAGISCKVAAIVLYPDSIKAQGEKWVEQVEARNRTDFQTRATLIGPKPQKLDVPADAQAKGYWLGFSPTDQDVTFTDSPGVTDGKLARAGARGQRVGFTFALRPLKDLAGAVTLTAQPLRSAKDAFIRADQIDLRYVHHGTRRTYNDIAYSIGPDTLRSIAGADLKLIKEQTRQFFATVHIPDDATPGQYQTTLTLAAGDVKIDVPLTVDVLPFALDEPDFPMGFFGMHLPRGVAEARGEEAAWRDLLGTVREAGMNSFSGGPNIPFKGLDAAGKPILDFARVDQFMKLAREAGFTKEICGYGGPAYVTGLHDSHAVGQTGQAWEKKTGKPFGELLAIVYGAVRDHAKEQNWLPVTVSVIDEPRVVEQAAKNAELVQLYREHAPWVKIGGSYSVHWSGKSPFDLAVIDLFKAAKWSSLNLHSQTDLDKAREFGNEIHIYNQGRSRYSFGAYQWAEMHKGVKSRMQWHLLALHGYVGSSRVDLQACKLEYSIVSPK